MKYIIVIFAIALTLSILSGCENREVNENEGPNFSEIHEEIEYHFDMVNIDGIDYHILERDRNNPHEGFGFMALDGQQFLSNQDSIKAYLKTMLTLQSEILSKLNNEELSRTRENTELLLQSHFNMIRENRKSTNPKDSPKN